MKNRLLFNLITPFATSKLKGKTFRNLLALVIVVVGMGSSWGQIYVNQFTGVSACPTNGNTPTMVTNSVGASLTRSTVTCNNTANVFSSTTINNTSSISNTSYIEFSATANNGYILNLTSVSFFRQGSSSAPNQIEVKYSTDGFSINSKLTHFSISTSGASGNDCFTGTVVEQPASNNIVQNSSIFFIYIPFPISLPLYL